MTPEERLQHSLEEYHAVLDSMRFTGASQVAEVQQLQILVTKYPDHARHFLADLDRSGQGGRHRAGKGRRPT
ncbi:hypothetical protein NE236_09185 [Actinoallomurus purpureus]|uniref:hypothetical protein n=1 Tax=Actinoallomurus purpureus TaxID=478114 RepID=UPI0020926590|nr:hypothetical protein [Actinoallomurus purpureus]MCO6005157.1 hypothetical protein [Actinoallomurus purpureus]